MNEDHVNSRQDLEKLQQKVENYKKVLTTLKNESSIDEQMSMLKKLMETTHQEQNTRIQKYEEEISMLSTQLDSLNHTIFDLTEKIASLMNTNTVNQDELPSRITERSTFLNKQSSMPKTPSFKQLQNLSAKPQSIERRPSELEKGDPSITFQQTDHLKKTIQDSHLPPSPSAFTQKNILKKAMPNLNKPSAQKKFSVKLTSAKDLPLANFSMNNEPTHLTISDTLNKKATNEIEETSEKEVTMPEHKHLSEDHQSKNEQMINPSTQMLKPPSKNNMSSSLLNFFRKK